MKLGISTLVWGRVDVFHFWAKNVLATFGKIPVAVAYSEPFYKDIIRSYGFIDVFCENRPLGVKANKSVKALKGICDHVITTGSDDVFSANMPQIYSQHVNFDYFGFLDCFFFNYDNGHTRYWNGYTCARKGEPIGAGKMLSASVLDRLEWRPFGESNDVGLDGTLNSRMKSMNAKTKFVYLTSFNNAYIVDIKKDNNLTSWETVCRITHQTDTNWINHVNYDTPYGNNL